MPDPVEVLLASARSAIGCLRVDQRTERIRDGFQIGGQVVVVPAVQRPIQQLTNEFGTRNTLLFGQPVETGRLIWRRLTNRLLTPVIR